MEDGKFTMFAGKSVALAEVFKYTVGKDPFVGPTVCRLELSAPNEESTDGGRLAIQHVSIVPEGGGPSTVIATVYQVEQRAEGRQYEVVEETYKKRFHKGTFPVSPGQFDEMARKLKDFFKQFGFKYEMAPLPATRPSATAPRGTGAQPVPGAAPVVKRATAAAGAVARTASRSAVVAREGGGARPWLVLVAVVVVAAAVFGVVTYLLRS